MQQKLRLLQTNHLGFKLKFTHLSFFLILLTSCTASRWQIEDDKAIDPSSGKVLEKKIAISFDKFTQSGKDVIGTFSISEINSTKYDQKVQVRRYIQQYSPSWGWFALGFGATGMLLYMGNGLDHGSTDANNSAQITYNVLASATFVATLYNQKPVGTPRRTEELKFLLKTGETTRNDTVRTFAGSTETVLVNFYFKDQLWLRNKIYKIESNTIKIPFFAELSLSSIKAKPSDEVLIDMEYKGTIFEFLIPIEKIMTPYVSANEIVAISSRPSTQRKDLITQVSAQSIFPLESDELGEWYSVNFGATIAYLPKNKTEIIWSRPNLEPNIFVTNTNISKSNEADIEQDIPLESRRPKNPRALLISNKKATDPNTKDDLRALKAYLVQTFGYESDEILTRTQLNQTEFKQILKSWGDEGTHEEITLFYAGALFDKDNPYLEFVNENKQELLSLDQFYSDLNAAKGINYRIFLDVNNQLSNTSPSEMRTKINRITSNFLQGMDSSFIWFSTFPGQKSVPFATESLLLPGNYSSFMYYFLLGVKKGIYTTNDLKNYINKEVNFTSRKVFDQSQETFLIQNKPLHLIK